MFNPFNDFESAGYLRNKYQEKDARIIKRIEHEIFVRQMPNVIQYLSEKTRIDYEDFLAVHRILFSEFYPWAGQDRAITMPNSAVKKGDVLFSHPQASRLAVEHGLRIGQDETVMNQKPGEVMGLFAYGHPFLDGNGRTMLLVHMELCHRAGFSLAWQNTKKADYLDALTEEINRPGKGVLDFYLLQFKEPQLNRGAWGVKILALKGLDGLDEANQVDGDLTDPAVAEKYKKLEEKRGYAYASAQSLAQQWNAALCKHQCAGKIVALSEAEVIQEAGRGRHVVWDRRKLQDNNLEVGKKVTIYESGKVIHPPGNNGQEL